MVKSLSFTFSNKSELFGFCHWGVVIDSIYDKIALDSDVFLIVFCPQPSILTNRAATPRLLVSGSHPEEVLQFFDSQASMLLNNVAKISFQGVSVQNFCEVVQIDHNGRG